MTAENLIGELWRRCLMERPASREVPADADQKQFRSPATSTHHGCTKQTADVVVFGIDTMIHWDGTNHRPDL